MTTSAFPTRIVTDETYEYYKYDRKRKFPEIDDKEWQESLGRREERLTDLSSVKLLASAYPMHIVQKPVRKP